MCRWLRSIGGWNFIIWFNWVIVVFTAIFGFGLGGYASIKVCTWHNIRIVASPVSMQIVASPVIYHRCTYFSSHTIT